MKSQSRLAQCALEGSRDPRPTKHLAWYRVPTLLPGLPIQRAGNLTVRGRTSHRRKTGFEFPCSRSLVYLGKCGASSLIPTMHLTVAHSPDSGEVTSLGLPPTPKHKLLTVGQSAGVITVLPATPERSQVLGGCCCFGSFASTGTWSGEVCRASR